MPHAERIIELLGGLEGLSSAGTEPPRTELEFVDVVRAGLPYRSFEFATAFLHIKAVDLSRALGLKLRTLARRKDETRLNPTESERILRLARVFARAEEILGSEEAAHEWIRTPSRALGGREPLGVLDTDIGTEAVLNVLGRIEHGIVS